MTRFYPIMLQVQPSVSESSNSNLASIIPFGCNVLIVIKHLMLEVSTMKKHMVAIGTLETMSYCSWNSGRLYSNGILTVFQAISLAAESKREEERAKGVNPDNGNENPDIVPFEDNEEEEEEESEEEDESFGQAFGPAAFGRGSGGGIVWPPIVPFGRGARPYPGMRGFPPRMMSDGFSYGSMTPDGFPMPDLFGMGGRPFGPFGPRFPGDMMFHNRPPAAGGFGMMMGPGTAPFMGGMGPGATGPPRGGRPMGMHPSFIPPPSQPSQNPRVKRDPKDPLNERIDRFSSGSDQRRGQEMAGSVGGPDEGVSYPQTGNSFRNDESESEDEAPRRSRHGDGKK